MHQKPPAFWQPTITRITVDVMHSTCVLSVLVSTQSPVAVTTLSNTAEETTNIINISSSTSDGTDEDGGSLVQQQQQQELPSSNTSTTQPPSVTAAGKTKRDDGPAKAAPDNNPPPVPEPQRAAPPVHRGDVAFTSTVQHHVTAFIAWQQSASCGPGHQGTTSSAVVGYRLRYGSTAVSTSTTPTELTLSSNVAAIDGLLPSDEYWYQVRYVFDDGSQSPWTDRQILQT